MSDPPKSASMFPSSQPATSGGSGSLFGQTSSNQSNSASGLFGSNTTPALTSTTNLFGNTSTAGAQSSGFGGGSSGSNIFGGGKNPGGELGFGSASGSNKTSGLFGNLGSQQNQPSSSTNSSTGLTSFATPDKPSIATSTAQQQSSNVFGGGGNAAPFSSFSNLGSNTSSANSTTPTSKPTSNLFGNSTTPAGPPPSTSAGANSGSVLFGKPPQDAGNPFAKFSTSSSGQATSTPTAPSSGFSGFFPPASKAQEPPTPSSSTQSSNIFGSTPGDGSNSLFGNKRGVESEGGLFGEMKKTQDAGINKPAPFQQVQGESSKSSNAFGLGGQSTTSTSGTQASTPSMFGNTISQPTFSLSATSQAQPSTTTSAKSPTATAAPFNLFKRPASSGLSTASTNTPSLFPSISKSQDKSAADSTFTSIPSSAAPAPTSTLFGDLNKTGTPSTTTQAQAQPTATDPAKDVAGAGASLSASTAGPPPPAQSRLKNKSMDDIITRWASDLSRYQKEFQQQAEKVASWDRMLVENSEKIQQLYGSTLGAERATTEIERQLTAVENDQAELSMWLDRYEKEVDDMISTSTGQDGILSGPDQERERTYQLAAKLSDRLDEMGKDLSTMIEEINDASSALSKNNKADDPLSQVVRVLNSHLTQLQQIDQGAAALQLKVREAQRTSQTLGPSNSLSGPTSDAADGFYRSYMGRR